MHRSASESAEEKKGVIIEAEVRCVSHSTGQDRVRADYRSRSALCVSHSTGQDTRERERRLRASESAEQRESRLAKQRVRDTARRAAQSTVQRERALQQRRERFTDETTENREARLETVRQ